MSGRAGERIWNCIATLRPAGMCAISLKKGCGGLWGYTVDIKRSNCINLMRFQYVSAGTSSESAPCTNIPIICPICNPKSPVIWTYCLDSHFRNHRELVPVDFPIKQQLSTSETEGMRTIWKNRYQIKKKQNLKNKKILPLVISNAHTGTSFPVSVSVKSNMKIVLIIDGWTETDQKNFIGAQRGSGRVRKTREVDSLCECNTLITPEEKPDGTRVMECKRARLRNRLGACDHLFCFSLLMSIS